MVRQGEDKSQLYRQLALLSTIPILIAVGPLVGLFLGKFVDNWLGTSPYLTVLFVILGFVAAGKEIYNIVRKVNKNL